MVKRALRSREHDPALFVHIREARMTNVEGSPNGYIAKAYVLVDLSSTFVRSIRFGFRIRGSRLLLQAADDADERHEQRDHDRADDEREENDHDRLERRSHGRDRVVDFVVVNVGDLQKHFGQLTGLFADIDHADDHGRESAAGLERLHDRFAFLHAIVHLRDRAGRSPCCRQFRG